MIHLALWILSFLFLAWMLIMIISLFVSFIGGTLAAAIEDKGTALAVAILGVIAILSFHSLGVF